MGLNGEVVGKGRRKDIPRSSGGIGRHNGSIQIRRVLWLGQGIGTLGDPLEEFE